MDWNGLKARLRLLRRREAEERMDEEMRFHLEMEAERYVREGMSPAEARRRARVAFGGVEGHKEAMRDGRTFGWSGAVSLDVRLALRILARHRGLTLIGGFAMAVAIAVSAMAFEVISQTMRAAVPLDGGDRLVALQYRTDSPEGPERRVAHDFAEWRGRLRTVRELGAFRTAVHNLVAAEGDPDPIRVAEITASGFQVARTPPLLGRYLVPEDERPGAPRVMVIGHTAWQSRFGGDPRVVGRTLVLGTERHTVVGVMPEGFAFPVSHGYWLPLRLDPSAHARREGPALFVFGRLAPGATLEEARAELATVGRRTAAAHPGVYDRLRLVALPYPHEHMDIGLEQPAVRAMLRVVQLLVSGLLVVAVNLAILMHARTSARLGEIAVRSALGASRRRILGQLFTESLALSMLGAAVGLAVAAGVLRWVRRLTSVEDDLPFWIDLRISAGTALYALALALLAAAIMGVLPGLKATGTRLQERLREAAGGTPRLGRVWSALVVAQVAVAVAVLPPAVFAVWQLARTELAELGFAPEERVVGPVWLGAGGTPDPGVTRERIAARQAELLARLAAEPGVASAALSSATPGLDGPASLVELADDAAAPSDRPREAGTIWAGAGFFEAYGARIVAGRGFGPADAGGASRVVVVNRTFAERFLGEGRVLGGRFRYRGSEGESPGPWYEVVGVVEDFPAVPLVITKVNGEANVYHPAAPGTLSTPTLTVRFRGSVPAGAVARIRQVGAGVDPEMRVSVRPLAELYASIRSISRIVTWGLAIVTSSVLLLSAAGIYALMSFTVVQRTREIGIRTALGARPRRILASIFAPVARRLAAGVAVGSVLAGGLFVAAGLEAAWAALLMAAVIAITLGVGLLAAAGPARRGLRIQPMEALRVA
jgi:predicted permease